MIEGLKIQFMSDSGFDILVADVFYNDKYMFLLHAESAADLSSIQVRYFQDDDVKGPFKGDIKIDLLLQIMAQAKEAYVKRLGLNYNPLL